PGSRFAAMTAAARSRLAGSHFRMLNEQLYTTPSSAAVQLFRDAPDQFTAYHAGFARQVADWPINPLDVMVREVGAALKRRMAPSAPTDSAPLVKPSRPVAIYSFDLVSVAPHITACDIASLPLAADSVDVAVFCLALMGTNIVDFLTEALRVLRPGGTLKIAEVVSRFEDMDAFVAAVEQGGCVCVKRDAASNTMFLFLEFRKHTAAEVAAEPKGIPASLALKPCIYKRR
ncbi:hypothetical protein CXG81DRAFT_13875, partial [Caulochytrium protostelioides]